MELDNTINARAGFDGVVVEMEVGAPCAGPSEATNTPYPDNTTTWDLGDCMIEGGYNGRFDGPLVEGVGGSQWQFRHAYTGVKPLHHVRVALAHFAPGVIHNPDGPPVHTRFRMTSDVASASGVNADWFADNLATDNLACRVNVASAEAGATATASSGYPTGVFPAAPERVDEIRAYTLQDSFTGPQEPTPLMTAILYGPLDFEVQYADAGGNRVTVRGGAVTGNTKAMRVFTHASPVTTSSVRVLVHNAREYFSRIVELEAHGPPGQ